MHIPSVPPFVKTFLGGAVGKLLNSLRWHVQMQKGLGFGRTASEEPKIRRRKEESGGVFKKLLQKKDRENWGRIVAALDPVNRLMLAKFMGRLKKESFWDYRSIIVNASNLFESDQLAIFDLVSELAWEGYNAEIRGEDWYGRMLLVSEHLRVNTFGIGVGSAVFYMRGLVRSMHERAAENKTIVRLREEYDAIKEADIETGRKSMAVRVIEAHVRRRMEKQNIGRFDIRAWWKSF